MGQPKKRTSPRKSGLRRSHLLLELARRVNKKSPVKAYTTRKESGKALAKVKVPVISRRSGEPAAKKAA